MQTVRGRDGAMRLPAALPAHAMTTFQIKSPPRVVSCAEYGCPNYEHGWETKVPVMQAEQVRGLVTGRFSFTETRDETGLAVFTFPPGQECFIGVGGMHRLPWDGRERFIEHGGDWRGNPRGDEREYKAADWVDKFASHQDKLATAAERG